MPQRAGSTTSSHDGLSESLVTLKPYIHALVVMSRIIRWKPYNGDAHSSVSAMFLTLVSWTAIYYNHRLCLSLAVPLAVAYIATLPTRECRKSVSNYCSDSDDNDDEDEIRAATTELAELAMLLPSSRPQVAWSSSMVLLLSIAWQCVIYTSRLGQFVWLTGWVCFMWWNPWVSKIRSLIATFYYEQQQQQQQQKDRRPLARKKKSEIDRLYCFCVYEHQRWWLHTGWSSLMLPHDRPEWSDEYLEPTPSVDEFSLPPLVGDQAWIWADPQWKAEDWEYASWDWEVWSPKTSIKAFTRRRRWVRCAHLEKRPFVDPAASAPRATEDTTIPDNDSSYSSTPSLLFSLTSRRSSSLLTHTSLSSASTVVSHC